MIGWRLRHREERCKVPIDLGDEDSDDASGAGGATGEMWSRSELSSAESGRVPSESRQTEGLLRRS